MAKAGTFALIIVGGGLLLGMLGGHFARPELLLRDPPQQAWQQKMRTGGTSYPYALDTGPRHPETSRWAESHVFDSAAPPLPDEEPDSFVWAEPTEQPYGSEAYDYGDGAEPLSPSEGFAIGDEWPGNSAIVEWPNALLSGERADESAPPAPPSAAPVENLTREPRAARGDLPAIW